MRIKYIIYPPICIWCNNVIELQKNFDESFICEKCLLEARRYIETENLCLKCSRTINIENKIEVEKQKCNHCLENEDSFHFEKNISVLEYNSHFRKLLRNYKFGYNKNISSGFVKILENYLKENKDFFKNFDIITSVPIYKGRAKYRGFDQSKLIAEKICNVVDKSYCEGLLIKIKNTYPQTTVPREQRITNIKDTVVLNTNIKIENKRILLIDDVFTTGSTLNECTKVLKEGSCGSVTTFTVLKVSDVYRK